MEPLAHNNGDLYLPPSQHPPALADVTRSNGSENGGGHDEPPHSGYEAFIMTGDRVLKLSKNQQGSILPKQRKVYFNQIVFSAQTQ